MKREKKKLKKKKKKSFMVSRTPGIGKMNTGDSLFIYGHFRHTNTISPNNFLLSE